MKFNKKVTTLFAATALSAAFLTGCGSETEPEENDVVDQVEEDQTDVDAEVEEEEVEVTTTASINYTPESLVNALSADGTWIFAALDDITLDETLVVEGEFTNRDAVDRKLGLYTTDADRNVAEEFTLTVPEIIVKSPNFRIHNGTVVGDIVVEAEGFSISDVTIEGNITFASQELMDAASLEEGTVTGEVTVAE